MKKLSRNGRIPTSRRRRDGSLRPLQHEPRKMLQPTGIKRVHVNLQGVLGKLQYEQRKKKIEELKKTGI